ncbi:MAG: UDP-N-acetylglucosamine 2-epimerase [Flavobacteriales bacterium]|nr:UDP-N-acetylglucosamine 2-epimerase [Flavobacteriales bacterium]
MIAEGTSADSIHLVGNTMIDSLVAYDDLVQANDILERSQLVTGGYALMTMHRPATVDDPKELDKMISLIEVAAKDRTVVFSVHPRTRTNMERFGSFKWRTLRTFNYMAHWIILHSRN